MITQKEFQVYVSFALRINLFIVCFCTLKLITIFVFNEIDWKWHGMSDFAVHTPSICFSFWIVNWDENCLEATNVYIVWKASFVCETVKNVLLRPEML